jgi:hypothetical protein
LGPGSARLRFTHHLDEAADPASVEPGWEYYLDRLVAARAGAPRPEWNDYPAQKAERAAAGPRLSADAIKR